MGKVENYTPEQLRAIGLRLYELGGGDIKALLEGNIEEIDRLNYGFVQVVSKAMKHYGLDRIIKRIQLSHSLAYPIYDSLRLMLIERLNDPCSKRQNYVNQLDYIGLDPVLLHQFYRTLDRLDAYSEHIQQHIYQVGRDLFNNALDVVFYDVTTLYFERQKESDEDNKILIRRKGFSKDGKVGDTQILFSLLIDKDKNPIGYEIFEGNKFEGHTFKEAIKRLREKYNIDKIVVVADRGMLNKENIQTVLDSENEYIIGERLKNLPKKLKTYFTDITHYDKQFKIKDGDGEHVIKYCIAEHNGRKIIGTYSAKRAEKDRHDREAKLQTAEKLLKNPELIQKKASQFFIKKEGENTYQLDHLKIENHSRFDGFLAIATNAKEITEQQAVEQYKQLYKIEQTFRVFKSYLQTRPMFHWTDKRIKGHICLCYIAYTLLNWIQKQIEKSKLPLSENDLRAILSKMQVSIIKHNDKKILLRSKSEPYQDKLLQIMGIKPLPPLLPIEKIEDFL